jgi:hypothetical protein
LSSPILTPGSTRASRRTGSMSMIRFIADIDMSTPRSVIEDPVMLVCDPAGVIVDWIAATSLIVSETSSAD